jgi:hypothetical protein
MRGGHFIQSKMSSKAPPSPQITPAPVFDPNAPKPKRKCSERQLQVLKEGREKSSLYHALKSAPSKKKTFKKK